MTGVPTQAPIKVGALFDTKFRPSPPWDIKQDLLDGYRLALDEAVASRLLDRRVEIVFREAEGLPLGAVKPVFAAFKELADEGCLAIFGPCISDNAVPLSRRVNADPEWQIPMVAMAGSEEFLGEYTFMLNNGSEPDEPPMIANILAHAGHRRISVIGESGLIGQEYCEIFRRVAPREGLRIMGQAIMSPAVNDVEAQASDLAEQINGWQDHTDAILYFGFGYGPIVINRALEKLGWKPPRYTISSWETGFMLSAVQEAYFGWIGMEQYDETNKLGAAMLNRFEARYKRRPRYFAPFVGYDIGNTIANGIALASSLSPEGVKEGLEKVKMLPAACGAPGTRISFGKWARRGWVGEGYMVAREFDPKDRSKSIFRGRIGEPKVW